MKPALELETSGRVASSQVLDTQTVDAVIDSLLAAVPLPHDFACDETGLCVPFPSAIPIAREQIVGGIASPLELCTQADTAAAIDMWERARMQRGASLRVHLRQDPERSVTLHILDARHRFGIYLGALVGTGESFTVQTAKPAVFRPRVCSVKRDEVSVIREIDGATTQILGWTAGELVGGRTLDLVHPDDRPLAIANWMEMLARPGLDQRALLRFRHRDGNYICFEVTHRNLLNDPAQACVLTEMVDVSERMEAVEALRASEQLLRRLTETLPLGVVQIDAARRIVYCNELALAILGTARVDTVGEAFARVLPSDREEFESAMRGVLVRGDSADIELTIERDGDACRCHVSMRALTSEQGGVTGAIVCAGDITDRVRLRDELERRAKFDNLTRCHSRAAILEALESVMEGPRRNEKGVAVIFVDLDRFKEVNDRHGHAAGDELLRQTGERLLVSLRAGDIVGRLGGDEFLVVCPDVATPDTALEIARRIASALAQRTTLGTITIVPSSSIGVAWTERAIGCDAIVAFADEAMYEAKRSAGGPVLALR